MAFVDNFLAEEVAGPWICVALVQLLHWGPSEVGGSKCRKTDGHQRLFRMQQSGQLGTSEAHILLHIPKGFELT
jgi:hypothetical protein